MDKEQHQWWGRELKKKKKSRVDKITALRKEDEGIKGG